MARPGRKRKGGPREPNGRLQRERARPDHGTPEQQARRARAAQGARPELASYPLGVLLASGCITETQHLAGCHYAWLHQVVFGRASAGAVRYDREPGRAMPEDPDDKWLAAREAELRQIERRLAAAGLWNYKRALDSLAVYEVEPRWMRPLLPRVMDIQEGEVALEALNRLAEFLRGERRAA